MKSMKREDVYSARSNNNKNDDDDKYLIIIDKYVYDLTKFMQFHPGGERIIKQHACQDCSQIFHEFHSMNILRKYHDKLVVARLVDEEDDVDNEEHHTDHMFGESLKWCEPSWYQGYESPFYSESHREFRAKVRQWVDSKLTPFVSQFDETKKYPRELHRSAYEAGILGAIWPQEYGGTPPAGFDAFHDLILVDEICRCGGGGILWALFFAQGVALQPILSVGSTYLKDLVARKVISGEEIMSLAVTEPYVGSDVAQVRTSAVRDGDVYVVNGEKKFITAGVYAKWFTVVVRTGGPGMSGISLLLMDRDMPGFTVRHQHTQGMWVSGTSFLTFKNVRVPVANLIGEENRGWKAVMYNFNHERFVFAAFSNRFARTCLSEAIKFARVRKTFGRRLLDHQVIAHKIADMARQVEATHALLEQTAYQMSRHVDERRMGGVMALLKVQATRTFEYCARESSQILGGAAYIRGNGVGGTIERLFRETRFCTVAGGSEEVMYNLAIRQAKL